MKTVPYQPEMSSASQCPIHLVTAWDECGQAHAVQIAGELPLTLVLNEQEVVTLMTLGSYPEALALGYLRNQNLINELTEVKAIQVHWETATVVVTTFAKNIRESGTITSSCGQGAVLSVQALKEIHLVPMKLEQSLIYTLLQRLAQRHDIHSKAGGVHGCALCQGEEILTLVEDVGRHNAVDTVAGLMWLQGWSGDNKIFYTTGRLTSEIVMKVAHLGIPILISRSGVTYKGVEIAKQVNMTLLAHVKGQHFFIFHGKQWLIFDQPNAS
jgi:FdhD protein